MNHFSRKVLFFIGLLFITSCTTTKELFVDYSNSQIEYSGRIDTSRVKAADLYWSGSSIKMNFEGESLYALLEDENGDNFYNVKIDNDSIFMIKPDTIKKKYMLASKLSKGKHVVEIFKRTEWDRGKTTFFGFQIVGNPKVLPKPAPKKRKIEFYGNSITAGYAVEDFSGNDSPAGSFTNNYLSYASITAKNFNAQYRCICKSGIGVMVSWFPLTMPELYNRLIPEDPKSLWDFSLYTPDVVVINLFQNDSWLVTMPENAEFKTKFGTEAPTEDFIVNSYAEFVSSIRKEYPEVQIICTLGNMDATKEGSKWPDYVKKAVEELNDPKIYTHFMSFKNSEGHPTILEQEAMAKSLTQFIDAHIKW